MKLIWGTASLKHRGTNSDDTARHLDPATPEALSLDFLAMWANQFIFTQGTLNLVFCHLQPTESWLTLKSKLVSYLNVLLLFKSSARIEGLSLKY